jgi:hypothetical protein
MTAVRAILIDPEARTFSEVQLGEGIDKIQELIGCHSFTTGSRPLNGSMRQGFDTLYVSDDYLEDRDDPRHWFQVDVDRDPPSSFPIAGRGLVVGVDEQGAASDARISLAELTARIAFTQRKFRGFEVTQHDFATSLARGDQFVPLVSVTLKAPLIEGTDEDSQPKNERPESCPK